MRKSVSLAAKIPSFRAAAESIEDTLEIDLGRRRLERLAERIGRERVTERDDATKAWDALPLVESAEQTAAAAENSPPDPVAEAREQVVSEPPELVARDIVATQQKSEAFGRTLAAAAWALGFAAATLKAFVADGLAVNWTLWNDHFKHHGFVPILDFIHALTYLTNQQSRMNYAAYRKLGLPITSSHVELSVKMVGYRVKGTEKFWGEEGGDDLLQLRADILSDTRPLDAFWTRRTHQATGIRTRKPRQTPQPTQATT